MRRSSPRLDVVGEITAAGEQGLLGLAFHPEYERNGRFFVHYSGPTAGETVIAEYARSQDPDVADPVAVATVLTVAQPANNHNGGSIEFGGDAMLYVALGDGGGAANAYMTSRDPSSLLGKILRLDVSTLPYRIPPGNFAGAAPEVWAIGVRNPWRMSFDPCTGDLYFGDVGELTWEEVNVEARGRDITTSAGASPRDPAASARRPATPPGSRLRSWSTITRPATAP